MNMPDSFYSYGFCLHGTNRIRYNKILAKGGKACYNVTKHENVNQR